MFYVLANFVVSTSAQQDMTTLPLRRRPLPTTAVVTGDASLTVRMFYGASSFYAPHSPAACNDQSAVPQKWWNDRDVDEDDQQVCG